MTINLNLAPHQAEAFNHEASVVALISGTGAGKTWMAARWIILKAIKLGGEVLAISPTFPMLKRTLWREVKKVLTLWKVPFDKNEQEMIIRLPLHQSVIYGVSADKPERMEGIHARAAVMDEAGQMNYLAWETVRRRVAFYSGQVLISSTPYRWNWLKTEVYDQAMHGTNGSAGIHLVTVPSTANPYYPLDRFEQARTSLPDWRFKMFYLGQFTRPLGIIYPDYRVVEAFELPADWQRLRGVDFGFNNPAAIIWMARAKDDPTWYLYREWKASGATLDELRDVLKTEPRLITYADPSAKGELETLKRWGIDIRPARKDVLAGITYLQGLFKQGHLKVFALLKKTIDELNTYSWALDKNDDPLDVPEKTNDHLLDGLRYALFTSQHREGGVISGARLIGRGA
jgi:phage terminase large subunit